MSTILKNAIKPGLKGDILNLLKAPINDNETTQQDDFAEKLSEAISASGASAVQSYLQSNVKVSPGIAVATAGSPAAQTGATTAPGTLIAL
jgi:hypothetical protein